MHQMRFFFFFLHSGANFAPTLSWKWWHRPAFCRIGVPKGAAGVILTINARQSHWVCPRSIVSPAGDREEQKSLPTLPQDGVVTQAVDAEMLRWPRNSSDTHPGPRKVIFFHMIPTDLW